MSIDHQHMWPLTFALYSSYPPVVSQSSWSSITSYLFIFFLPVLFFSQPVSHCQSHFKSVSCFNLLNLIFPQLFNSFPLLLLPIPRWIFFPSPCSLCDRTVHFILYLVLSPISHFVWSFHPSLLAARPSHLSPRFFPSWAQIRKGIIFFL